MRNAVWTIVGLAAVVSVGCRNNCQQICVRMADYAEECGFSVPSEQVATCIDQQGSGLESEDRKACRDYGSADALRSEWTCDDLEAYWSTGDDGTTEAR